MVPIWSYPGDDRSPDDGRPPVGDDILVDLVAGGLLAESCVRGRRVTVMVQNRVVILEGEVDSEEAKKAAGRRAWSTPGVFDVCNLLVAPPP
ncbi:BON domain-containing protein [Actinoplanes sp. NPDC051633]|uniref:BON domain-containing protein n=1 Tax=Actinoplanes sp. NPDC051633 TaxID=3155670 RepID=UPI00341EECE7